MRRAADGEDASVKHVAMENRLYPMRELLGDLLMEAGQSKAALAEYTKAIAQNPNRFRGLFGAARAAEASGDRQRATDYYSKLVQLSSKGDGVRPEVRKAQEYLAGR
jgi:tetratricopeptide (TPR) repeat protein